MRCLRKPHRSIYDRKVELLQETAAIRVIPVNVLFLIAAKGDVTYSVGVLDTKRSGHAKEYGISSRFVKHREVTPIAPESSLSIKPYRTIMS